MGVVLEDDFGDGHRALIVGVEAEELRGEVAVLHYPQRGEYHRDAEGDEAQAADGGDELVSAAVAVGGLPAVELGVEVCGLVFCEAEADVRAAAEDGVEVVELLAESLEVFVEGGVGAAAEDIVPDETEVEDIEDETAEESVLGIGDEVEDLAGRACEQGRETRVADVDIFTVFAADVGDGLVVEGFAEAIGVVAVVGAEGVGEGVALGLEHQPLAVVVAQNLIDCGG